MAPRPSIVALATLIAIIFLLILHQFSSSSSSTYYHDVFTSRRSLKSWLIAEEEHYNVFLQDRQRLIRKWGPTEAAVQP
jgi:hypothetical protein